MAYSITPQAQQREMQDRQIRAQQEAQAAAQEVNAFNALANLDLVDEAKPTPLPMNWQHSADTAARRAAQLEQMNLQHQQRLAELAERDRMEREQEKYKYEMRAKYAPPKARGGGTGYGTQLQEKFLKVYQEEPASTEQASRKERVLASYAEALRRTPQGRQFLQDLETGAAPQSYRVTETGTKFGQQAQLKAEERESRNQAAAQAMAQRDAASDRSSRERAVMALAKLADQPGTAEMITDPAVRQAVLDAQRERNRMAAGRPAAAPAAPTRAPAAPAAPARAPAAPAAARPVIPKEAEQVKPHGNKLYYRIGKDWWPVEG